MAFSFFSGLFGPKDILPDDFPAISWETGVSAASLESLRGHITRGANVAATWYLRKRAFKRLAGQGTRLVAMVAVAAAGVLPVLAQILGESGQYAFSPAWATVLLAAAALLVSLDYFFGFTSGWVRYLEAEQRITRAICDFQFDWEIMRMNWVGREPTAEEIRAAVRRLKDAILQVYQIVQDETAAWAAEFRTTIQRLDEAARARADALPTATGATVTVTNAAGIGPWTLAVDDEEPKSGIGSRRALVGLRPGPHKFVAEGQINNQTVRDEVTAEVHPNGVTEISLTLR